MAKDDFTTHRVKGTDTPRPCALFTIDECDQFDRQINQAYALADLLHCSFEGGDGPESGNVAEVSGLLFERLQDLCDLWQKGVKRDDEGKGASDGS